MILLIEILYFFSIYILDFLNLLIINDFNFLSLIINFCVLKTVGIIYTGQGWKTLEGGAPADITLSLSFEETEIVTQEDVFGETKVGDFSKIGGTF